MTDVGWQLVAADERGCVDAAVKKDVILRIFFAGGPLCAIFYSTNDNDRTDRCWLLILVRYQYSTKVRNVTNYFKIIKILPKIILFGDQ